MKKVKKMKKILSIAGSDNSGGAGIQADIKTISAHKMFAMSALTALTAQNTCGVYGIKDVGADFLRTQIDACFSDIVPDAVKIGMVLSAENIVAIEQSLVKYGAKNIVFDPVLVATSGGILSDENALKSFFRLIKIAQVITPNIPEAIALSGLEIKNESDMKKAALKIVQNTDAAILLKGGHLNSDAVDILLQNGEFTEFRAEKIPTKNTHGTGCTLSSAIACALAAGLDVKSAVAHAKDFVTQALKWKEQIGQGNGAIDHYFRISPIF